jgi:hypothetical protein
MDANLLVLALLLAVMPMPILAGVLLLTTEHGRPKAIALACGGRPPCSSSPPSTASRGSRRSGSACSSRRT